MNTFSTSHNSRMTNSIYASVLLILITAATLSPFLTIYMGFATAAYLLLILGLIFRKNRVAHRHYMLFGVGLDLIIVLTLEFTRGAIATATGFTLTLPQHIHILFSTLAVLLYVPLLYMGLAMTKTPTLSGTYRKKHIRIGVVAFLFRTIGFIFMFSMLKSASGL